MNAVTEMPLLERLQACASAEEFFAVLALPFDRPVLDVARLHILRRMGEYLSAARLAGLPDAEVYRLCRLALERAYGDFVASSPLEQRVFKVLKSAVAPKKRANFVPLSVLQAGADGGDPATFD